MIYAIEERDPECLKYFVEHGVDPSKEYYDERFDRMITPYKKAVNEKFLMGMYHGGDVLEINNKSTVEKIDEIINYLGELTLVSTPESRVLYDEKYLSIGTPVEQNYGSQARQQILVSPGQFLPYFKMYNGKYIYKIAVQNNKVKMVFANLFTYCDEEIFVGERLSEIKELIDIEKFKKISGWGYVLDFSNDWKIAVCIGRSGTDFYPDENSPISFFYKE